MRGFMRSPWTMRPVCVSAAAWPSGSPKGDCGLGRGAAVYDPRRPALVATSGHPEGLTLRAVLHLVFRQTEGLIGSIIACPLWRCECRTTQRYLDGTPCQLPITLTGQIGVVPQFEIA